MNAVLVVGSTTLIAFLDAKVKAHKDQYVRRALVPLAELTQGTGVAIVVVRHLNKAGGGDPFYKGGRRRGRKHKAFAGRW